MAQKVILGTETGRDAFKIKVNDNFTELYDKDVALEEQINYLAFSPQCQVVKNTTQSISAEVLTVLTFSDEIFDNDNIFDVVSDNTKLVCNTSGLYLITANVQWGLGDYGYRATAISLNGQKTIIKSNNMATNYSAQNISGLYKLNANDYLQLFVATYESGSLSLLATNDSDATYFSIVKVG